MKPDAGQHPLSFSPEDLPSNFLGTWVARQAIAAGGAFDAAATFWLNMLIRRLGARPAAETQAAFAAVTGRWFAPSTGYLQGGYNNRYLLRRSFAVDPIVPWLVPGLSFCGGATAWPSTVPQSFGPTITNRYDITFLVPSWAAALGPTLNRSAFGAAIATIRAEARQPGPAPANGGPPGGIDRGYGPDFETP